MSDQCILVDRKPVPAASLLEWGRWFEDISHRRVALTETPNWKVSTVFLGIDHGWGGTPQWFETMVFRKGEGSDGARYMERYATWEEAEEGHKRVVAQLEGK